MTATATCPPPSAPWTWSPPTAACSPWTGRDSGRFPGAVVGLGALGIVTTLTLDLVPAFQVRQYVYEDLPAGQLTGHFDEIMGAAYSVSVFTGWQGGRHSQVWLKHREGDPETFTAGRPWHGARPADGPRHPVPGMPAATTTPQGGVPGPWHERLPHFRLGFTPSSGTELQTEYLLPRQAAVPAIEALSGLGELFAPVLQISEIRTVAADEAWLSTAYRQDSVALHFTWILDTGAVLPVIAAVERELVPLGARPHWGKVSGMAPQAVRARYPRWDDFRALARSLDPAGKLRNDFMDATSPARTTRARAPPRTHSVVGVAQHVAIQTQKRGGPVRARPAAVRLADTARRADAAR